MFRCARCAWRRERDLNPRGGLTPPTRLAGEHFRPLSHPSEWDRSIRNGGRRAGGREPAPTGPGARPSDGAVAQVPADVADHHPPPGRVQVAVDAQELAT